LSVASFVIFVERNRTSDSFIKLDIFHCVV